MAEAVGRLRVDIAANTGPFNTGLNAAGKKVGWFSSRVGAARAGLRSFGSLFGVGAGALGVGAIAVALDRSMKSINQLGQVSSKLGIPVERLQELRYAAQQTGVEVEKFDDRMRGMQRRLAAAAQAPGKPKGVFAELGLDPKELMAVSPDKALDKIADALKNTKNPSDRLRQAFELFGAEGVDLVNMLARGSEGLREFAAEARAAGGVLNEEMVDSVSRTARSIDRMKTSFKSLGSQITGVVAKLVNFWTELPLHLAIMAAELEKATIKMTGGGDTSELDDRIEALKDELEKMRNPPKPKPGRGRGDGEGDLPAIKKVQQYLAPAALQRGTAEAYSAVLRAGHAGKLAGVNEKILAAAEKQVASLGKIEFSIDEIARTFEKAPPVKVANL